MQTSYTMYPKEAYAGGLYDLQEKDVMSYVDPNETIYAGKFVARGSAYNECKAPSLSTDITANGLGVTLMSHNQPIDFTHNYYTAGKTIPVLKKGRVFVDVEEAVAIGDPVYVRFTSGSGGTVCGAFRMSADSASAALVPAANAKWYKGAASGDKAVLEVLFIGN